MASAGLRAGCYLASCREVALPGACIPDIRCDRCTNTESTRNYRYTSVRYALIAAYLYEDSELTGARAKAFLPHTPGHKRPASQRSAAGRFGELERAGRPDDADHGA